MKKILWCLLPIIILGLDSVLKAQTNFPELKHNEATDLKKNQIPNGNVFSIEPFAPLFKHFTIGHETGLGHDYSLETKISVISRKPSKEENRYINPMLDEGGFVRTGVKFYRQKDYINKNREAYHRFQGRYIKPEIVIGFMRSSDVSAINDIPKNIFFGALLVNFGRQYVFAERFVIGYEFGFGYAFSNEGNDIRKIRGFYYSHIGTPNTNFPIAASIGFNMGLIINKANTKSIVK
jgi:hypothetical protein